jgi:hypothetical protein
MKVDRKLKIMLFKWELDKKSIKKMKNSDYVKYLIIIEYS